jgi:hypothetical protein
MAELIYKRNTKKSKKNTVIAASAIITLPGALFTISLFSTPKKKRSENLPVLLPYPNFVHVNSLAF